MRIGFKFVIGFAILSLIAAGVGLWTDWTNRAVRAQVDSLAYNSLVDFADATEMQLALMASHVAAAEMLETQRIMSNADTKSHEERIRQSLSNFRRSLARAQNKRAFALRHGSASNQAENQSRIQRAIRDSMEPLLEAYRQHSQMLERFLKEIGGDDNRAAMTLYTDLTPHLRNTVLPLLEGFKQSAEQQFTTSVRDVDETLTLATRRGHLSTAISLTSSVLLGLVFSQLIGRPLARLTATTRELGSGKLSTRSDVRRSDEIGQLAVAINHMAFQLESTMVSKAEVDNILASMREMLLVCDQQHRIAKVNPSAARMLGYEPEDLVGKHVGMVFGADHDGVPQFPLRGEQRLVTKSGETFPVHCSSANLRQTDRSLAGYLIVALDLSEQKLAQAALERSLCEKDILLRELHHRVKNNLQIISSLLQLQGRETKEPQAARLLRESEGRVRSMSLIHEQLYSSPNLGEVDFREYLTQLAKHLETASEGVRIKVDSDIIRMPISQAVPCGMIVNELVSNAVEHAFLGLSAGSVCIFAGVAEGMCRVSVVDNGVGMEAAAAQAHPSLGLQIVRALVDQLRAQIVIDSNQGTRIEITFPLDESGPRWQSPRGEFDGAKQLL